MYMKSGEINIEILGRGTAWLDTGTFESLFQAGSFIKTIEQRQGMQVGCPEEIAFIKGWITRKELESLVNPKSNESYENYLLNQFLLKILKSLIQKKQWHISSVFEKKSNSFY